MKRLVVATLLMGLTGMSTPAHAVESDRAQASWEGVDVPYTDLSKVMTRRDFRKAKLRFHDTQVRYFENFPDGVFSIAATADSAIAMLTRYGGEGDDIEGPLVEVGADGTTGRVERRALGIPMADPLGHVAFWTKRDRKRGRLVAYDTTTHTKVLGPVVRRYARVFAVEGDTAYVMGLPYHDGPVTAASWTPGDPELTPIVLPPSEDPESSRLIIDVDQGDILSAAFERDVAVRSDPAGNVLGTAYASFGALSPSGQYSAFTTDRRVKVIDVDTGAYVPLQISKKTYTFNYQWTPDGRVVLTGVKGDVWGEYDDSETARRWVCTVPDGACSRLPGRSKMFYEPYVESSSWGQIITLLIPIGSKVQARLPKAPERYLRQR